jgi:hypothetical protein
MTTDAKRVTEVQQLSAGDLKPLTILIDHLILAPHFPGDAMLKGADPEICSPHHLAEASGMAQLLMGIVGAAIWYARTGQQTNITIGIIDALHPFASYSLGSAAGPHDQCRRRICRHEWHVSFAVIIAISYSGNILLLLSKWLIHSLLFLSWWHNLQRNCRSLSLLAI